MHFKFQLVAYDDNGQADDVIDIAVFDKACEQVEQLGLTLAEAKALLQATQQAVLEQQTSAFLRAHAACPVNYCEDIGIIIRLFRNFGEAGRESFSDLQ